MSANLPDRETMRKTVLISLGAFLILVALGLWVANSQGLLPGYVQLRSYTDDASGLMDGTKVRLDGIPIGYLDHQRLTGSRDRNRAVEFDLKVKSSYLPKIPVDSIVRVVADNLLSDKAINIIPGTAAQHVEPAAELRSAQAVDPNKMMAQMGNELQQLQQVVNRANDLLAAVDAGQGSVGKMKNDWESEWSDIPVQMRNLMADYRNAHGTVSKIFVDNSELTDQMQTTQKRIADILGGLQAGQGTAGKLPGLRQDIDQTMKEIDALKAAIIARTGNLNELQQRIDDLLARVDAMMDKLNSGQGTFGQFLVNPQLSQALAGSGREFQTLTKDMRANPKKFFTLRLALF